MNRLLTGKIVSYVSYVQRDVSIVTLADNCYKDDIVEDLDDIRNYKSKTWMDVAKNPFLTPNFLQSFDFENGGYDY